LHHEKTLKFDRMPPKKILIGCFSVPGMGGANTAAYKLFEFMQGDGREVAYMNIIDEQDSDYYHYVFGEYWGNPKRLPQVYNCVLSRPPFVLDARHKEVVNLVEQWRPDLLIGIDFNATLLLRSAAPRMPLVFLTTGCDEIKTLLPRQDALRLIKSGVGSDGRLGAPLLKHEREQEAVAAADLIVTNAEGGQKTLRILLSRSHGENPLRCDMVCRVGLSGCARVFPVEKTLCDSRNRRVVRRQPVEPPRKKLLFSREISQGNRWVENPRGG
jgi:hypothetical protein